MAQMCCRVACLPSYAIILQMPIYGHPPATGNGDDWGGPRDDVIACRTDCTGGEVVCSALMCLTVKSLFIDLLQTLPLGGIVS